ncbi:MAG: ABC transporter ATP-binding protein, partial [Planctomycetales bacterium]
AREFDMIEVKNLVKKFDEKEAVRDVAFRIGKGEIVGYLGPNGAGKSTTLKMLVGALRPTSGSIAIGGNDLAKEPLKAKRLIGYVPESGAMYETLTPHEYWSLAAELHEVEHQVAADRIHQLTQALQLQDGVHSQIQHLSKGMRQKTLLISALLHDPEVILFDEPLSGLDVNAALALRRLLEGMAERGKAILYSSHILDVVERVCSRVIVLNQGEIVADDATETLLASAPGGKLEDVFRSLTSGDETQEWVGEFLDAVGDKPKDT